jgi:hypothetical protein
MMYIIGLFLFSLLVTGIMFYLIEHSPSGFEDENGFHLSPEQAPHYSNAVGQRTPQIELSFGKIAGSVPLR